MELVVTAKGIIGMACAKVQEGDKVCLLEGTCENSPILLREVALRDGRTAYKVVGPIFLAEREADPKYPAIVRDQVFDII
jgi:hypothetical protein